MGVVERACHVDSTRVLRIRDMALAGFLSTVRVGLGFAGGRHCVYSRFLDGVPVIAYPSLRTIHLLCGVFAVPALMMYGVSAVQMAHSNWFAMKPAVTEVEITMSPGYTDGRRLAHDVMASRSIRGEIASVKQTQGGLEVRITVPGTVHEIRYEGARGRVRLRTSVAGFMGMLNRLHHAAGLSHEYLPLRVWGIFCAVISLAMLGLGVTGIWMWWLRKQERKWGLVLLSANLAFAITVLVMLRAAGP
jgi:hypothetical protein